MTAHKHQPIVVGAAQELLRAGKIETFDAVYKWVCPECGLPQRTTRLADTIYTLRHAYGWEISTNIPEADQLAVYVLVKAGDMPGDESKGPHPRQLVRNGESVSVSRFSSDLSGVSLEGSVPSLPTSIHDYDGKPIPVEAIPSPSQWRCTNCDHVVSKPIGQPALGGFRRAKCPSCGAAKTGPDKHGRIFAPVR